MLVAVLQQYLLSLVAPLRSAGASQKIVADLENACNRLDRFREFKVEQVVEFLTTAEEFQRTGVLPDKPGSKKKGGAAKVIDRAKVDLATQVLRELAGLVSAGAAAPESVDAAFTRLEADLSKDEAAELARQYEIDRPFRTAKSALKELRGRLFPAPPKPPRPAKATADPARVQELAQRVARLRELAFDADRRAEVEAGLAELKQPGALSKELALAVAREVGVVTNSRMSRDEALRQIERQVFAPAATLESIRQ